MLKQYILRPTSWEGVEEPKAISFSSEDPTSITPTLEFIDSKVVVRPCREKNSLTIMAYGMTGFNVIRRGASEKGFVPRGAIVMIFVGDKVVISETEYYFVIETTAAPKKKTQKKATANDDDDDDDDDDDWSSSSSFSSDFDDDYDEDGDAKMGVSNDPEGKDIQLSALKERLFKNIEPLYPTLTKRELRLIAQNTSSVRDASSVIFNPNFVRLYTPQISKCVKERPPPQEEEPLVAPTAPPAPGQMPAAAAAEEEEEEEEGEKIDPAVKSLLDEFPDLTLEQAQMAYEAADREEDVAKRFIIENFAVVAYNQGQGNRHGGGGGDGNDNGGRKWHFRNLWPFNRGKGKHEADNGNDGNGFADNHAQGNPAPAAPVQMEIDQEVAAAAAAAAAPADPNDPVNQLREIFPRTSLDTLRRVLASNNNDVQRAVNRLLMMDPAELNNGGGDDYNGRAPPPAAAPPPRAGGGGGGGGGANYPPPNRHSALLEEAHRRGMIVNVDISLPWQSLQEMPDGFEEYIYNHVKGIRDDREMQHTAVCLQTMIENEQRRYNDSYCFYHSYSVAHLDYELNALIATIVYDLDTTEYDGEISRNLEFILPPVPRVSFKPFTVIKSIKELSDFCTGGKNNNDPNYQAVGLSVSTSIFSKNSPAPPVEQFRRGYSAVNVDFGKIMRSLLNECGFDSTKTSHIVKVLEETAKRYNMPVGCNGFGSVGTGRATGHMLQIFIKKAIVDQYAYPSQVLGYRNGTASMSETLAAGNTNGQARIYITPDLLRKCGTSHHEYSQFRYYCADMKFNSVRAAFVLDVKRQLSDLFLNEDIRNMIRKNIREKYGKIN